jgi:hypothetical protein
MGSTLLEKLIVANIVKFTAYFGNRRLITVTKSMQLDPVQIQVNLVKISHPVSLRSFLILSFHQSFGIPSDLFPSGLLTKI